jgi:hypothetical protein
VFNISKDSLLFIVVPPWDLHDVSAGPRKKSVGFLGYWMRKKKKPGLFQDRAHLVIIILGARSLPVNPLDKILCEGYLK